MGTPPADPTVPTRVRYGVLSFLCTLSFVLYIDRVCIGQAGTAIQAELRLSDTQWGLVLAAFTVAYGLFEVPAGRWGDRFGSRGVLVAIVWWWSLCTALTGAVGWYHDAGFTGAFALLLTIRFLFGAGEAGALPNMAAILARWFPADSRGPAQGLINTSMLVGGAAAPVATAYLIQLIGWRWAFVVFGGLGVLWAIAFWIWFRDDPASHPKVNDAERALIGAGGAVGHAHGALPWGRVLSSRNVWLMGGIISCAAFASYMYMSWWPNYLKRGHDVSEVAAGWLAASVLGVGAIGSTIGGFLSDRLRRWQGFTDARTLLGGGCLIAAGLMLALIPWCDGPVSATVLACIACGVAMSMLAAWWSVVADISGPHVGALFGLMNSMGVLGAAGSQFFFGRFSDFLHDRYGLDGRYRYDPAFSIYAAMLILGGVLWLLVRPSRSAVDEPPPHPADG